MSLTDGHRVGSLLVPRSGILTKFRDKKAIVQIGKLPFTVNIDEWVVVMKKAEGKEK